jgi:glyoxylase-like metal-dependent hydrolase (beta-lactamase superfamily II)
MNICYASLAFGLRPNPDPTAFHNCVILSIPVYLAAPILVNIIQRSRTSDRLPQAWEITVIGFRFFAAAIAMVLVLSGSAVWAQDTPKRSISKVAGDLYRFQNNFHVSVFLVTPEGIILGDPINKGVASWLKAEVQKRFDVPVKYVVYSHDHSDHSSGGEVFADSAIFVGHENTKRAMIGEKRPTAVPDVTFSDTMTIELGGRKVNLVYPGKSHSDNLIVMHFPAERAVFTVDFISVKRVAFKTLGDSYFPDWIEAIKRTEEIDFDIVVPGHGPVGTKADARDHREYLQTIYDEVLAATRSGMTLEQMKVSIDLSKYSAWGQYEAWSPLNIEGVYRQIQMHRRGN